MIRVLHGAFLRRAASCSSNQVVGAYLLANLLDNPIITIDVRQSLILLGVRLLDIRGAGSDFPGLVDMTSLRLHMPEGTWLVFRLILANSLELGVILRLRRQVLVGVVHVLDVDDVITDELRRHLVVSVEPVH